MDNKDITLEQLLNYCSNRKSPNWERGWRLFLKKYKMYIYKVVSKRCTAWNVSRLNLQFSDVVNDIVTEIFMMLVENDAKILQSFRARDNERMFLAWLATVSNRVTTRYLQRYFSKAIVDEEMEDFHDYLKSLEPNSRWELYETIVDKIRSVSGGRKRKVERDIHLFMLYNWADFSEPMIRSLPVFQDIGNRVLDNVINRIRKILRASSSDLV